ncbi:bestrophin family ion channel [Stenotrophomonas sp. NRRL B-14846]|uniref:bestrophin family ion channel n=1 Tax=Stenotrophomonas sp. NRRL B-14846 TaxID=3162882 RepID=UPI003D2C6BD0
MNSGTLHAVHGLIYGIRRPVVQVIAYSAAIIALYRWTDGAWIRLPASLLVLLGAALAITFGFKAARSAERTGEVRRLQAAITAASRSWLLLGDTALNDRPAAQQLGQRHLAWQMALRYQLYFDEAWEQRRHDRNRSLEYGLSYQPPEKPTLFRHALARYVDAGELARILAADSPGNEVLALQGEALKSLLLADQLHPAAFLQLHRLLHELRGLQAQAERMRVGPDTRAQVLAEGVLLCLFALLLPFGLLDAMGPLVLFDDHMVGMLACWIIVPLSALLVAAFCGLAWVAQFSGRLFDEAME